MTTGAFSFFVFAGGVWAVALVLILRDVRANERERELREKASRVFQRLEARRQR